MSDIEVTICCVKGHFTEKTLVDNSLRDEVREIGKELGIPSLEKATTMLGGRFVKATLPEEKLQDFRHELGKDYEVTPKIEMTADNI